MNFRNAIAADLPVLNRLSVESKRYWKYPEAWIQNWMDALTLSADDLKTQQVLVCEDNKEIIGFCSISESDETYEVEHLWVRPVFMGKGFGKALLNESIKRFTSAGKPVRVESDPNAEAFYERQGFVTIDTIESYPKGRFLPVMIRKL